MIFRSPPEYYEKNLICVTTYDAAVMYLLSWLKYRQET